MVKVRFSSVCKCSRLCSVRFWQVPVVGPGPGVRVMTGIIPAAQIVAVSVLFFVAANIVSDVMVSRVSRIQLSVGTYW